MGSICLAADTATQERRSAGQAGFMRAESRLQRALHCSAPDGRRREGARVDSSPRRVGRQERSPPLPPMREISGGQEAPRPLEAGRMSGK